MTSWNVPVSPYNTRQKILTYGSLYCILKESVHSIETPPHRYLVIILFLSISLLPFLCEILAPISTREETYDKSSHACATFMDRYICLVHFPCNVFVIYSIRVGEYVCYIRLDQVAMCKMSLVMIIRSVFLNSKKYCVRSAERVLNLVITNSMKHPIMRLLNQEIPHLLWNPELLQRSQEPAPAVIPSQINPVYTAKP